MHPEGCEEDDSPVKVSLQARLVVLNITLAAS